MLTAPRQSFDLQSWIEQDLLPRVDRKEVFRQLLPEDQGAYYLCNCPACGGRMAHVYKDGRLLVCDQRDQCGLAVDILAYVNGGVTPDAAALHGLLCSMAEVAGVDTVLLEKLWPTVLEPSVLDLDQIRLILDAFFKLARIKLMDLTDAHAGELRDYLSARGFFKSEIDTSFGICPDKETLADLLQDLGVNPEKLDALLSASADGCLVLPMKDLHGNLIGFWAQHQTVEEETGDILEAWKACTLYPPTPELPIWGLFEALSSGGRNQLVLLESPLVGALLQTRGLGNAAALGRRTVPVEAWELLAALKVKTVILMVDNDSEVAKLGLRTSLQNARAAASAPMVYVLDPAEFREYRDAAELLKGKEAGGLAFLREVLERPIHPFRFEALELVSRHGRQSTKGKDHGVESLIQKALEFDQRFPAEKSDELVRYFWPEIGKALPNTDFHALLSRRNESRQRLQKHRELDGAAQQKSRLQHLLQTMEQLLHGERFDEVESALRQSLDRLDRGLVYPREPVLSVADELEAYEETFQRFRGGRLVGIAQKTLPLVDELTYGLHGLMVLTAAPGTPLLDLSAQLGLHAVRNNPDVAVVFLSLEQPRRTVVAHLLCAMAEMDRMTFLLGSKEQQGTRAGAQNAFTPSDVARLKKATDSLRLLGNRIQLLDERNFPNPSVERMMAQVRELKAQSGVRRALVVIDSLQSWPVAGQGGVGDLAQLNIRRMQALQKARFWMEDGECLLVLHKLDGAPGTPADEDLSVVCRRALRNIPDMVMALKPFGEWDYEDGGATQKNLDAKGKSYYWLEILRANQEKSARKLKLIHFLQKSGFEQMP